mgnify:CR=1 FL=1
MTEVLRDFPDAFIPEGVVDAASSEEEYEKWREAAAYGRPVHLPGDFASLLTREEASERAGLALSRGGWLYPKAGLVHAGRLARRMLEAAQAQVLTNMPVSLRRREGLWEAVSAQGVVVAALRRRLSAPRLPHPACSASHAARWDSVRFYGAYRSSGRRIFLNSGVRSRVTDT